MEIEMGVDPPGIGAGLSLFFVKLHALIEEYREYMPPNKLEDEWIEMLFKRLLDDSVTVEVSERILSDDDSTSELIEKEIQAVTERMSQISEQSSIFPFRRKAQLKDGIKAGGVVVGSIKDLLGDLAPYWLKSMLTIAEEAVNVVTG